MEEQNKSGLEETWLKRIKAGEVKLYWVPEKYRTLEVCLEAIKQDHHGWDFEDVPKVFYTNSLFLEAVKTSIEYNGAVLQCIPEELCTPELCLIALKLNGWAASSVPKEFYEGKKLLSEKELKEKYSTEELLTSNNPYLRKLGASNDKNL
jgi:hypothetical protein